MQYLKEQRIYFTVDRFDRQKCTSVGQFIGLNPTIVHRQSMYQALSAALAETAKSSDPEIVNYLADNKIPSPPPIHFEVVPQNEGFSNGTS